MSRNLYKYHGSGRNLKTYNFLAHMKFLKVKKCFRYIISLYHFVGNYKVITEAKLVCVNLFALAGSVKYMYLK